MSKGYTHYIINIPESAELHDYMGDKTAFRVYDELTPEKILFYFMLSPMYKSLSKEEQEELTNILTLQLEKEFNLWLSILE